MHQINGRIRRVTDHAPAGGAPASSAQRPTEPPAKESAEPPNRDSSSRADESVELPALETAPAMNVRGVALTILSVLGTVVVLQYAQAVLIPIVLGVLISYVLAPLVDTLARRGLSRWAGAAVVIVLICGALGYSAYKLAPQILSIVEDMPDATRRVLERTKMSR